MSSRPMKYVRSCHDADALVSSGDLDLADQRAKFKT